MSTGQANSNISLSSSSKVVTTFYGDNAAADEGSFFTTYQGLTASTAVALTTQATALLNPIIAVQNTWPSTGGGFNMYLRYIKIWYSVVPTSATSINYVHATDPQAVKLTTLGTLTSTPANTNSSSGSLSKAVVYGGVNVAAALSGSGRILGQGQVTGANAVIFDEHIFHFGSPAIGGDLIGTQTAVKRVSICMCPTIVAPQTWWTLSLWGASWAADAPTFGFEMGWIERPSGQ